MVASPCVLVKPMAFAQEFRTAFRQNRQDGLVVAIKRALASDYEASRRRPLVGSIVAGHREIMPILRNVDDGFKEMRSTYGGMGDLSRLAMMPCYVPAYALTLPIAAAGSAASRSYRQN